MDDGADEEVLVLLLLDEGLQEVDTTPQIFDGCIETGEAELDSFKERIGSKKATAVGDVVQCSENLLSLETARPGKKFRNMLKIPVRNSCADAVVDPLVEVKGSLRERKYTLGIKPATLIDTKVS